MEESSRTLLYREAMSGRMNRRQVIRRAAMLGLSVPAIAALLAACGGGSKDTPTTSGAGASTSTSAATYGLEPNISRNDGVHILLDTGVDRLRGSQHLEAT